MNFYFLCFDLITDKDIGLCIHRKIPGDEFLYINQHSPLLLMKQ
ncbi:hypothetical protein J2Z65_004103 [Paenibacillus aceris]|uniref:Uncharacterized protein n=1 Tax=Paenibacillus aceris TaxID=869555 RepID=A0ABS4I1T7_9BACL|nr:hypothetical protein [Paenibacillus aceris]